MSAQLSEIAPSASVALFKEPRRERLLGRSRVVDAAPTARLSGHRLIKSRAPRLGQSGKLVPLYENSFGVSDTGLASAIDISELSIQNSSKELSQPVPLVVDRLIIFLERMSAGWAGPCTFPPSAQTVEDVLAVSYLVGPLSKMPEVEVDPDSGSVSLIWTRRDKRRSFALMFDGDRRVIGTMACLDGGEYVPWSLAVDREVQIAAHLEDADVAELLAGA
jgi:hypothetical protein